MIGAGPNLVTSSNCSFLLSAVLPSALLRFFFKDRVIKQQQQKKRITIYTDGQQQQPARFLTFYKHDSTTRDNKPIHSRMRRLIECTLCLSTSSRSLSPAARAVVSAGPGRAKRREKYIMRFPILAPLIRPLRRLYGLVFLHQRTTTTKQTTQKKSGQKCARPKQRETLTW